jgi:cytochrome c551/c552/cytochrome c553
MYDLGLFPTDMPNQPRGAMPEFDKRRRPIVLRLVLVLFIVPVVTSAHASMEFARQKNCLACHSVDRKLLGPAYKDVAARYDGQPGAVDMLTNKILQGGSGVWGSASMPANRVTTAEAKQLAQWVLGLKEGSQQQENAALVKVAEEKVVNVSAQAAPKPAASQQTLDHGKYLVEAILACGNCHSGNARTWGIPDQPMSGGRSYDTSEFKVTAGNLTSDPETGLGKWTADDIKHALRDGARPNGIPLAPAMPWGFVKAITNEDLDAVAKYLVTLPPVHNQIAEPLYRKQFQNEDYPDARRPFTKEEANADPVSRGRYLAALAHCMACHTPVVNGETNETNFERDAGRGGKRLGANRVLVPNITSHPTKGLGNWTDEEIKRALVKGIARDGHTLDFPMPWRYFARLTPSDVDALVAWLRSLPPKE